MQVEIERGIALPIRRHQTIRYPFKSMRPGDSFLLRCADKHEIEKARSKVMHAARYRGTTVQTRTVPDGLRVWLISGHDDE